MCSWRVGADNDDTICTQIEGSEGIEMVITWILTAFFVIALVDRAFLKGRLGLGKEFDHGLAGTAPLILSMTGMMCIAPALGQWILSVLGDGPLPGGMDIGMLSGVLFAIDMGGYPVSVSVTSDPDIIYLGGVLLGSMLGTTIVYTIPLFYGMCEEREINLLSGGLVLGLAAIPVGVCIGGLFGGVPVDKMVRNMIPVLIFSLVLVLALCLVQQIAMRVLRVVGQIIEVLCVILIIIAVVQERLQITLIPGLAPLEEQLGIIAGIGVTLAGAYPMMACLCRLLGPFIKTLAGFIGVSPQCMEGMIGALANPMLYFQSISGMGRKEITISMAFVVSVQCVLGDHLGYIQTAAAEYTGGMIVAQLSAGVAAVVFAEVYCAVSARRKSVAGEQGTNSPAVS